MDRYTPDNTISNSKEESIARAIRLVQERCAEKPPVVRPRIATKKLLAKFVLWLAIMVLVVLAGVFVGGRLQISPYISHSVAAGLCLAIAAIKAKAFVRGAVLLYQKYAPEEMRRACLFTPSCSQYMLLAVEKYGTVVGVGKGLRRLCRCHRPNGGEDYP